MQCAEDGVPKVEPTPCRREGPQLKNQTKNANVITFTWPGGKESPPGAPVGTSTGQLLYQVRWFIRRLPPTSLTRHANSRNLEQAALLIPELWSTKLPVSYFMRGIHPVPSNHLRSELKQEPGQCLRLWRRQGTHVRTVIALTSPQLRVLQCISLPAVARLVFSSDQNSASTVLFPF